MPPNLLLDIATAIWQEAAELPFVPSQKAPKPFRIAWVKERFPDLSDFRDASKSQPKQAGWYWLATNLHFDELRASSADAHSAEVNYKSIGAAAAANLEDISKYICVERRSGKQVVYNGHEHWVRGRLGGHNFSKNLTSGALRISQHPGLRDGQEWSAFVFTESMASRLASSLQDEVKALAASSMGRRLVEAAWRSAYGWPLLCRQ